MIPNTVFWIEEADNMHGVHKGRPALEAGGRGSGSGRPALLLFLDFPENSLVKAPARA